MPTTTTKEPPKTKTSSRLRRGDRPMQHRYYYPVPWAEGEEEEESVVICSVFLINSIHKLSKAAKTKLVLSIYQPA